MADSSDGASAYPVGSAAPVAVPPNPPVVPTAAADSEQLAKLAAKNREIVEEKQRIADELAQLKADRDRQRQQKQEEAGEFKTLWEQAQASAKVLEEQNKQLQAELETLRRQGIENSAKTQFMALVSRADSPARVANPEQFYTLLKDKIRPDDNGNLTIVEGGVARDPAEYVRGLTAPGSGWEHHFIIQPASGVGAPRARSTVAADAATGNPWLSGNITQQLAMQADNPDLAKQLQAAASTARNSAK